MKQQSIKKNERALITTLMVSFVSIFVCENFFFWLASRGADSSNNRRDSIHVDTFSNYLDLV